MNFDFSIDLEKLEHNDFIGMPCSAEGYFSADECNKIIQLAREQPAEVAGITEMSVVKEDVRRSRITWLNREARTQWVFDKMDAVVSEVNETYKFELSGFNAVQVAQYSEGDHFDWHMDLSKGVASNRKLSITVQLSDPADYDGGELEMLSFSKKNPTRDIGSMIVFPSFLYHRVAPVTRGVRWSLVGWIYGPPIR